MKLVIIESPYKGRNWEALERNVHYLRSCIRDCVSRGESPYASHRMLTDAFDDKNHAERELGIQAGLAWRNARYWDEAKREYAPVPSIFYVDLGWSDGMTRARVLFDKEERPYEIRKLPDDDPFFLETP